MKQAYIGRPASEPDDKEAERLTGPDAADDERARLLKAEPMILGKTGPTHSWSWREGQRAKRQGEAGGDMPAFTSNISSPAG